MLLLIDNYDSFTYNLFQYLSELGEEITVARNDKITLDEIEKMAPVRVVISPGPGTPEQAGISNEVIQRFGERIPILGVCLGHQCVGYSYGALVSHAGEIRHGKSSDVHHDGRGVFQGLPNPFPAIRYHSLAIDPGSVPECLEVTARTDNNIIMGVRHREHPVEGVQFHPESVLTGSGKELLKNFLKMTCKNK
jgi:anthranilate synthase component 2